MEQNPGMMPRRDLVPAGLLSCFALPRLHLDPVRRRGCVLVAITIVRAASASAWSACSGVMHEAAHDLKAVWSFACCGDRWQHGSCMFCKLEAWADLTAQ